MRYSIALCTQYIMWILQIQFVGIGRGSITEQRGGVAQLPVSGKDAICPSPQCLPGAEQAKKPIFTTLSTRENDIF